MATLDESAARYLHDPIYHAHVVTAQRALVDAGVALSDATDHALTVVSALYPTVEDQARARAAEQQAREVASVEQVPVSVIEAEIDAELRGDDG